ncbi:hypothetical protein C8R44DRAFT_745640 [Mycena epipterygia]|nr:hypothetical protein C8R44DRAFT_745640 [Mycena epipterygia]
MAWGKTKTDERIGNDPLPVPEALLRRPMLICLEQEMAQIDEEMQRLEKRREELLPLLELHRVALAPHKMLPIDVLREIFIFSAPTKADLNDIVSPRRAGSPDIRLILCKICSHWRSIALDTHELWSAVRVNLDTGNTTRLLEVLGIWLSRSGQSALTLNIAGLTGDHRATTLLTQHSHRLRSLCIHPENPFVASSAGSVDLLETLELRGFRDLLPSMPVLTGARRLRRVTLRGIENFINVELCGIPWHQLTKLYLEYTFTLPSQLYSILHRCSALATAHLSIFQPDTPVPPADRNIVLPQLRTLQLEGDDLTSYTTFLNSLQLPSLENLTLHTDDGYSDGTTSNVPTFPAIRRLSINEAGHPEDGDALMVVPWLRACPSALEVCLPRYWMPDAALDEIANGSLLPNVVMLTIDSADPDVLVSTLQARQRSLHHSTITETAFDSDFSETLKKYHIDFFVELMMSGVFVCGPEDLDSDEPQRGKIEERALLDFKAGLGVFKPLSDTESDGDCES